MQIPDNSGGPLESGGSRGGAFSLAGWEYVKDTGVLYIVMGKFYIVNCKWLPEGEDIVRKWGSGGVVSN